MKPNLETNSINLELGSNSRNISVSIVNDKEKSIVVSKDKVKIAKLESEIVILQTRLEQVTALLNSFISVVEDD